MEYDEDMLNEEAEAYLQQLERASAEVKQSETIEMTPAAASPAVETLDASAVEETAQTTLQAESDEHVALDAAETETTVGEKADGEHVSEETVVAALGKPEPPSMSSADTVETMSNDGFVENEPSESHASSKRTQETLQSDAVNKALARMGFYRCEVKGDGDCLLLSIMAGAEITCNEAKEPDKCALDKVALLRRGAIDVLMSESPLDGISRAVFWAGERLPESSESVWKEMGQWTNMHHWRPSENGKDRGGTFILCVSMFLGRPVFVIQRDRMHFVHLSRVYGDREDNGKLKKSIAKPKAPRTIPTFAPIKTEELLKKLEHLLDSSRQQQGHQSVITLIEYNGENHFDAWVAPSREVVVGDRVRVTVEQQHGKGTFTGMVAPISPSINVDARNNILLGTDGGAWTFVQRSRVHKEIMLPNEQLLAPVVRSFTMRHSCATGMLLGYAEELVFGSSAAAYHAHIVCTNVYDQETTRTRSSGNSEHNSSLRTYRTGDWVVYSEVGPGGEKINAAVVRIVAKARKSTEKSTEQARNMLILLGNVKHEHEDKPTLFLGAPGDWHRMVDKERHDVAKLNIDSVDTPVLRLSNDEISQINQTFMDKHVNDLPTTLANAIKMAYSKPPMLTALQKEKAAEDKKQVNAKKAEAARAKAASRKSDHDGSKDRKGKRGSRSDDATSTPARDIFSLDNNADAAQHSKKQIVQQADGARATGRSAPRRASAASVGAGAQDTREDADGRSEALKIMNAPRKEETADAKIDEDVVETAKLRATRAKREAEKAKAELETSKAEAERLNAIAEKAKAEAEIARAQIAIAQAEQVKFTAASMQSARERQTTVQTHAYDGIRNPATKGSPAASSHDGGAVRCHWNSLFENNVSPQMSGMDHHLGTPQRAGTKSEMPHTNTSSAGPSSNASMHAPSLPSAAQHGVDISMSTPSQPDHSQHHQGMPRNGDMPTMRHAPSCSYWMPSPSGHISMQPHDWPTRGGQPFVSYDQMMLQTSRHHDVHSPTHGYRHRHNYHDAQATTPPGIVSLRRELVGARAALAVTASTSSDFAARQSHVAVLTFDLERMESAFREKNSQTRPRSWGH